MAKIVFVEDEAALQKTLGQTLRERGHQVVPALNGLEGVRLIEKEKPDLVLLDLILPKMDGIEVLKAIRAQESTKDVPVIILTNMEGANQVEEALRLGATTYLVKTNYTLEEVADKVEQIIND